MPVFIVLETERKMKI